MTNNIIAYTDGACKGNGQSEVSAGGFGVHVIYPNGDVLEVWGGDPDTTNNRMELMAAITALERTPPDVSIQIWTDSAYVKRGVSEWLAGWKKRGWKKSDGKPVLNQDLWIRLDELIQSRQIDWQWIKGHAGHVGNERADTLANLGVGESGEVFISKSSPNASFNPNLANFTSNDTMDNATETMNDLDDYYYEMANMADDTEVFDEHDVNQAYLQDNIDTTVPASKKKKPSPFKLVRYDHQNPDYDGRTDEIREPFWAVLPDPVNQNQPERQLIMDTETTGFDPNTGDRVVEIGIVEMVKRKPTGVQLHVYLNPDKVMDDDVISVHGIHNEFLADKPRFADVAPYVYEFMRGAEIIAHNAPFDMKFLSSEFNKVGLSDFADVVQVTDSLMIARKMYPGQKNTLDALSKRLDVGQEIDRSYHGALKDSQILLEVYLAMTSGQVAMDMEEEQIVSDEGAGEIVFEDLSALAGQIICSKDNWSADEEWRKQVLG